MKRILSAGLFCIGVILMFYPWISDFLYQIQAGSKVNSYETLTMDYTQEQTKHIFTQAKKYNEQLFQKQMCIVDPFSEESHDSNEMLYEEILNVDGHGMMGFIEIPSISLKLPIFHGTRESVLEKGVGHVEESSFPIGGKSTHAVLTGHTGVSKAKLFTDLRLVKKGNLIFIHVLGKTLAYRVIEIETVLPDETEQLKSIKNEDFVTLVTCTPYGINSHRLLVKGIRTAYIDGMEDIEKNHSCKKSSQWNQSCQNQIIYAIGGLVFIHVLKKKKSKRRKRVSI